MKTCLVIYIGNGYSENNVHFTGKFIYSVDMRQNRQNHWDKIYKPLVRNGYKVDTCLMTNKHEKIQEFKEFYNAIDVEYEDFIQEDYEKFYNFYAIKNPNENGFGLPISGGRLLKAKCKFPPYDIYVFVRCDCEFKIGLDELKVDYSRMNWLWRETHEAFYKDPDLAYELFGDPGIFWRETLRVSGNTLSVVPKRFFNVFKSYYWLEHLSLFMMINDLDPIVSLDDVNFMLESEDFFVTNAKLVENPVYSFSKTNIRYL